jgi:alpha-galactosidase/6-phospho-beta-glucosidase family protein
MMEVSQDPKADLVKTFGAAKSTEQIVPIMDALSFDNAGDFQVNMPNKSGKLVGIPENVVVEVPARIDAVGVHIKDFTQLPPKILYNHIYPEWIEMERDLYAFKSGDKAMLLWQLLNEHQTASFDNAVVLLDELLNHPKLAAVEEFEKFKPEEKVTNYFKYPKPLIN